MDIELLRRLLGQVREGEVSVEQALEELRSLPYEDVGFAKIDTHRHLRTGFPEVVLCQGKSCEQVIEILRRLQARSPKVLATRASKEVAEAACREIEGCVYHEAARMLVVERRPGIMRTPDRLTEPASTQHPGPAEAPKPELEKFVMVLCAGTADIPVAEEAAVTAEVLGSRVERAYDVGVAGLHRLLDQREKIQSANVLVVVAGMEGALASVVGGMVSRPVIAVPTSIGYGASFGGLGALLAMLNSCAAGVAVVNIDNGFGAGYFAHLINR